MMKYVAFLTIYLIMAALCWSASITSYAPLTTPSDDAYTTWYDPAQPLGRRDRNISLSVLKSVLATAGIDTTGLVPKSYTINNHPLNGNIVITPSDLTQDNSHRFVTDTEKTAWNAKQGPLIAGIDYATPGSVAAKQDAMANVLSLLKISESNGAPLWNGGAWPGGTGGSGLVAGVDYATPASVATKQDTLGFTPPPNTRTINGHPLTADVVVAPADLTQSSAYRFVSDTEKASWSAKQSPLVAGLDYATPDAVAAKQDALGFTPPPNTRTINGHALTADVVITPVDFTLDSTHRFVTDTEKNAWNAKQNALAAGSDYLAPTGSGAGLTGINPANVTQSASYRFASDTEKATWNAKQAALGYTPLNPANNLSDISAAATARGNLGAAPLDNPTFITGATAPVWNSNAANGYHYIDLLNTIAFVGAPSTGMCQYSTYLSPAGFYCYTGSTWSAVGGGSGTIGGSTGSTDGAILLASGTGGATITASTVGIDANGVISSPKISGTPGQLGMYGGNSTDTYIWGWLAPAGAMLETVWFQMTATKPTDGQVMAFSAPTGSGGPGSTKVSAQTWITPLTPSSALDAAKLSGAATLTSVTTTSANTETSITSTSTVTGNINLDGVSASDYNYSNGSSDATYTPVFTSLPASGYVRYITATFGGGSGVDTMTWTNVNWIGTAGAAATTTNKKSTYACMVRSSGAWCKIVQEAY